MLYKRGDIWHYDFTVGGQRYRHSTKKRSKPEAREEERKAIRLAEQRGKLGASAAQIPTLKDVASRWFAARMADKKSAPTIAIRLEIMLRHLGSSTLVTEIDTPDLEDAIAARRLEPVHGGRLPSNATINRDLIDTTTRPILRYARRVLKLPVHDIEWAELRLSEPKGRSRSFTAAELAAWRSSLPEHCRSLFDFLARYGLRLSEAFFPLNGVEPAEGRITVRIRKNGLPHSLRLMPDDARDMAARYGRAREAGLETVWFREGKRGLEPLTRRGFQAASQRALKASGLADARPVHDLRHHAATAFLRLPGANLKQAQRLLGHENIASTSRYAHVDETDVFNTMRHTYGTNEDLDAANPSAVRDRTGT